MSATRLPVRILYVHSGADMYGASRALLRLVSHLDRTRFEPHVLLPCEGPLADAFRAEGVPLWFQSSLGAITRPVIRSWRLIPFVLGLPLSVLAIVRLIRRLRIDLVHTNVGPIVSTGAAVRLTGVRHVWHLREFFHEFGPFWKPYRRYMLMCADRVLCVSTPVSAQFPTDSRRVEVLHDALPLEEFAAISGDRVDGFRAQYAPSGARLVGVVGRIKAHRKGQEVFVTAIAELKRRRATENVKFLIIGSPFPGNEVHLVRLLERIRELDVTEDVVLTGEAEDIRAAMKSLEVLVLPSVAPEPFGLVLLEAMALGVAVIGTRAGGPVEIIQDGVSGILVEPGNSHQLADAIARVLNDRAFRETSVVAGRARLEARFALPTLMTRLQRLYAELTVA